MLIEDLVNTDAFLRIASCICFSLVGVMPKIKTSHFLKIDDEEIPRMRKIFEQLLVLFDRARRAIYTYTDICVDILVSK